MALDTNLQIAIMLLDRDGGSEQPGRAEQWSPGRACFRPGEGQHLLQELNQGCAAQQYSSSCGERGRGNRLAYHLYDTGYLVGLGAYKNKQWLVEGT